MNKELVEFNFGKERYIYARARDYIFNFTFLFQQATNIIIWMRLGEITIVQMVLFGIPSALLLILLFIRFMRFDVNRNIPAEFAWTWRVNPAYQDLMQELKKIKLELQELKLQQLRKAYDLPRLPKAS